MSTQVKKKLPADDEFFELDDEIIVDESDTLEVDDEDMDWLDQQIVSHVVTVDGRQDSEDAPLGTYSGIVIGVKRWVPANDENLQYIKQTNHLQNKIEPDGSVTSCNYVVSKWFRLYKNKDNAREINFLCLALTNIAATNGLTTPPKKLIPKMDETILSGVKVTLKITGVTKVGEKTFYDTVILAG